MTEHDPVDHPSHYTSHPAAECIDVTEEFNFNRGNVIKYVWRAGEKGDEIQDLRKARWYLDREIQRLERARLTEMPLPARLVSAWMFDQSDGERDERAQQETLS